MKQYWRKSFATRCAFYIFACQLILGIALNYDNLSFVHMWAMIKALIPIQ